MHEYITVMTCSCQGQRDLAASKRPQEVALLSCWVPWCKEASWHSLYEMNLKWMMWWITKQHYKSLEVTVNCSMIVWFMKAIHQALHHSVQYYGVCPIKSLGEAVIRVHFKRSLNAKSQGFSEMVDRLVSYQRLWIVIFITQALTTWSCVGVLPAGYLCIYAI